MKNFLVVFALFGMAFQAISQAPVPNTWDCTSVSSLPVGYSIGPSSYPPSNYSALGVGGTPSVKMNGDDQFLQIHLAGEAGVFSYWIKGTNPPSSGAPFDGQFDIELSDNGTTWTNKRSLINNAVNVNTITQYTDTVLPTTRYIRFYFTRKESGFNISLDDINVGVPLAKPEAEINAVIDGDTVFSGGNYYTAENLAATKRINVIIENQGTDSTLTISSVTSSNTPEFTVVSFATAIDSLSSDTLKIDFTPSALGTRSTVITINNNDGNENPYLINMIGYGGGLATEPNAPSSAATSDVTTYKYNVAYDPNSPASDEGYLVLFQKSVAPVVSPTDGVTYKQGDMIGGAKVAYVGSDTTYRSKETWASSTYHMAVYSFSGAGQYTNYSTLAATTSVTTPATMQSPTHYNTISTSATTFITDLHALTNPHTLRFYSDFDDTYIKEFGSRDTTNGQLVVTCRYSSDEYIYSPPFSFSYISREHSFPQSWMPTFGVTALPEYNDYHNLFPVNQNDANAVRSNNPMGDVVNVTSTFMDATYGKDTAGNNVYEPRDSQKGDAARAIFYMCIAYHSVSGNNWELPNPIDALFVNYAQNQDVLKKWHWQDPVDEWEMARNDYIESLQGNRNPFIDSMQYVCYIDFMTMTKVTSAAPCITTPVGLEDFSSLKNVSIYPNPANNILNVNIELHNKENLSLSIVDQLGRSIVVNNQLITTLKSNNSVDLTNIPSGMYHVKIKGETFTKLIKFVKN